MTALLHSVPEARKALGGIGQTQIYELIKTGQIKPVKIGRRTFITHAELERYAASLTKEAIA